MFHVYNCVVNVSYKSLTGGMAMGWGENSCSWWDPEKQ